MLLKGDGGHHLWLDDIDAGKRRRKHSRRLFQDGHGAVVAGDHGFEIKEGFGGIGRAFHVHREMPACGQDPDCGRVEIVEDFHVGDDIGVTRDIDGLALALDHETTFGSGDARAIGG